MRLVRLDHIHGGRSLELDPRLTVVFGAPQDTDDAIADALRAVVSGRPVAFDGQVELDGVRVASRDRTFDVADSTWIDPVLDLDAPAPLRLVAGGHRSRSDGFRSRPDGPVVEIVSTDVAGAATPPPVGRPLAGADQARAAGPGGQDPAERTRRIAEDDLVRLRGELRSLDGERALLERESEDARADLDSFARATLDVAIGQMDALGSRADDAVHERRRQHDDLMARRAELVSELGRLRSDLDLMPIVDAEPIRDALDRLVTLRTPTGRPDPVAHALADELEDLRRSMESLEQRRLAVEERLAEAEARLLDARREADAARDSLRSPELHPAVVRQLEAVRDEIFDLEERGGRVAAARARRRIDELRSEEATLLDQLGFDTYSAYVMGRPNRETESMRAMRRDRATAGLEQAADEVDRLRGELPGGAEDQWNQVERTRIVADAASLLSTSVAGLARLTTVELVDLLREQDERPSPQASAEVLSASGRLAAALSAVGAPTPGAAADPEAMEEMARRWLSDQPARSTRRAELTRTIDEAEHELDRLDEAARRADDGGRAADLDAEMSAIRSRVADCEARVARHERATAELAELRARELELRDRERDLLVRISDRERLLSVLGADVPPPSDLVEGPIGAVTLPDPDAMPVPAAADPTLPEAVEDLRRRVDSDASVAVPVDQEWLLLARLGELRSVGSIGSVPVLVRGLEPSTVGAPALLHRIASMSVLVQTILVTGDERLARWAEGLGSEATVLRW